MLFLKYIINNYRRIYIFPFWLFLYFFSLLYGLVIIFKRKKGYKNKYPEAFILSIGNITIGGTGKTETACYISKAFKKKKETAIVLRGYKGKNGKDAQIVSKNSDIKTVGDEALLLTNRTHGTVIVSKNKRNGVELAIKNRKNFIILDDAFQHWYIKRNLNLVLIDYTNPFGNHHLIPAGILREPLKALKYADAILIAKYDKKARNRSLDDLRNIIRKYNPDCHIFISEYQLNKISYKNTSISLNKIKRKKLIVLAAIGNPDYFISQIKEYLNPFKLKVMLFSDHHTYTQKDISLIKEKLKNGYDYVITTEKDFIKLKKFNFFPLVFQIKLKIDQENKFLKYIQHRIQSAS